MNKRRVLIAAIVVCLIAILACGSLAYFTFTGAKVINEFYTYSTKDFPNGPPTDVKELFSIDVYETRLDENGQILKNDDGTVKKFYENTYEAILPGSELHKDPTVENTGKYSAWVRLTVKVTKAEQWIDALGKDYDLGQMFNFNGEDWHGTGAPTLANNTLTYVFYSNAPLAAGETSALFDGMTIPTSLTAEDMIALTNFQIIIEGDAIQSDNNGTKASEGFANWDN